MNRRLAAIEVRRARLVERAARQRDDLAQALQLLSPPLAFADRCIAAVRFVVARPPLVAGAAFVFALLRPRLVFRWARRAWGVWQGYRWLVRKTAA